MKSSLAPEGLQLAVSHPAWVLMMRASSEKTVNGAGEGSAWLP